MTKAWDLESMLHHWKIFLVNHVTGKETPTEFESFFSHFLSENQSYMGENSFSKEDYLKINGYFIKMIKVCQIWDEPDKIIHKLPELPILPSILNSPAKITDPTNQKRVFITLSFSTAADPLFQYLINRSKDENLKPGTFTKNFLLKTIKQQNVNYT